MTVQSAIIAAIQPGSTLQTLSRRTPFEVAEYRDEAMVLLLGPQQSTTPIPWQIWEDLGAWLATKGWTELGGGRGATTSPESLNGFLDTRISRSVGSYAAAVLNEAGLVETQGVRPVWIRWLATPERTSPARDAANAWAQIQAICREAMATGRTIATIDRAVSNRILDVRPSVIVRVSDEARTPDGQGAPVTRAMVERIWDALVDSGRANRLPGVLFFAYALVAEIPGVAVDDNRRGLHVADWDLAMSSYQGAVNAPATMSGRQYWTLAAHPGRFRVIDAVRDLEKDWWLTGGADLHSGDRVAIWKYKGRDDRRGIIAFGEVVTNPEVRELSGDEDTYWVDPNEGGSAPQVRVRYVIKLLQPLWLEDAPVDSVLHQLPVSRAQGGTAHHVTPEQWTQLMTLVGGWPGADVDEDGDGAGWPRTEIQPTVASYFTMLRAELAAQPYVKAEVNREVQALTGRSRGAVEFKFANISAVLRDLGFPYVLGYQPRGNYQGALRAEVERLLADDPEMPQLLEAISVPDLPPAIRLVQVDPPIMDPPKATGRRRTAMGVNYLQRQERNQQIGLKGEQLVVGHERAWLSANGRHDLAEKVAHIPSTLGDGVGYDVSSFLLDGSAHHIEVKATSGGIMVPFFLSASELRHTLEHPGAYSIYRVFDLGPNPRFYKLTGNMREILDLTPVSYQARVKPPEDALSSRPC